MRSYSKHFRKSSNLIVNQTLIQEILEVVEQAAIASAKLTGLGQKDEADAAAEITPSGAAPIPIKQCVPVPAKPHAIAA